MPTLEQFEQIIENGDLKHIMFKECEHLPEHIKNKKMIINTFCELHENVKCFIATFSFEGYDFGGALWIAVDEFEKGEYSIASVG